MPRTAGARTIYGVVPARSGNAVDEMRTMRLAGHEYVMPMYAQAFIGRGLDRSLFDVTALSTAADPARLAVQISHTGGRPAVPGITVTADAGGVASGYLSATSAKSFGAAVEHRLLAEGATSAQSLFAGVTSITATTAPPTATPSFPMQTLVIKGIDAAGRKMDTGSGILINVDDGRKYGGFIQIDHGEARVSVPSGHYSGAFDWIGKNARGQFVVRTILVMQYTVSGTGQTLTVDARRATAHPSLSTPRPATGSASFTWNRGDAKGFSSLSFSDGALTSMDYAITPTAKATIGTQSFSAAYQLSGPGKTPAYSYDLYFAADHVSADQHRAVSAAQLGTIHERFDADAPHRLGAFGRYAVDPSAFFSFVELLPLQTPSRREDYVYAQGNLGWAAIEFGNQLADDPAELDSTAHAYPPGTQATEVWRHGPLGAGIPPISTTNPFTFCYACRTGNTLTIALAPFTDSMPNHVGQIYTSPDGSPVAHFTLSAGSTVLFDQDDYLGAQITAAAAATTYKAVLDVDRSWTGTTKSTKSHTELTFSSAKNAGAKAPASWFCGGSTAGACRVLPILQAKLAVPVSATGTLPVGTSTFEVDAAQVQGAVTAKVTGATLEVRPAGFDWVAFPLTAVAGSGGSRYRASVALPGFLRGRDVDVRIGARDAAGSTFSQSIVRAFTLTGVGSAAATVAAAAGTGAPSRWTRTVHPACAAAKTGDAACLARWRSGAGPGAMARVDSAARNAVGSPDLGYGPADIAAAYRLDPAKGAGQTVAIVDAYDNPQVASDLAAYRTAWGLPACTAGSGCFRKVNQRGGTTPPQGDPGWGVEIALDVQAVSAACPRCKILLVEADSPAFTDIGTAVNRAVAMGAGIISNSYGGDESGAMRAVGKKYYSHPGVAVVASSGDYGFGAAQFPAVWGNVIAVGGTTLRHGGSTWSESAWYGSGSGCSAYVVKPAWQVDTHCSMRTTSDVSAVADPDTGLAVYDTYGLGADNGWIVVGGTSLSAPLISAMIGTAGNAASLDSPRWIYQHRSALHDVVGGSNGYCGGDYLCTAKKGYDGPTGLGSPRGTGAL